MRNDIKLTESFTSLTTYWLVDSCCCNYKLIARRRHIIFTLAINWLSTASVECYCLGSILTKGKKIETCLIVRNLNLCNIFLNPIVFFKSKLLSRYLLNLDNFWSKMKNMKIWRRNTNFFSWVGEFWMEFLVHYLWKWFQKIDIKCQRVVYMVAKIHITRLHRNIFAIFEFEKTCMFWGI